MRSYDRVSGIGIIENVPWGTHLCQFYQTNEDLIDVLIPYFKAGLENNEFCVWVTSEPLGVEEAKEAFRRSVPDFDVYLEKGQIEIIPHNHWYAKEGIFDSDRVLKGWVGKLNHALANGYDGLRLTGNIFWLEKKDWNDFVDYEEEIDRVLGNCNMIVLCTYSLDRCSATEIIDVISNHQFALIKRDGKWEQIESSRRKQTREALLQKEEELNEAQRIAHIGSWYWDIKTDVFKVSDELLHIFGLACPPSKGQKETLYSSASWERLNVAIQRAVQKEVSYELDLEAFHVDGKTIWITERGEIVRDANGEVIGLRGTVQDITERKQLEEQTRQRAEEVEALMDVAPVAIWIGHDPQCHNITGNRMANEFYEAEDGENVSANTTSVRRFFYKGCELTADELPMQESVSKDIDVRNSEFDVLLVSGKWRTLLGSASPLHDSEGNARGSVGTFIDITERKQAEEVLKISEAKLRLAEVVAGLGHWEWDLKSNGVFWSEGNYRVLGYPVTGVKPSYELWRARVHPDDIQSIEKIVFNAVRDGTPYHVDYRILLPDGKIRHISDSGNVMEKDASGNAVKFFGTIQDITERKQAEEALRESEASLAKAQAIAHLASWEVDIRTNMVRGSEELYRTFNLEPDVPLDAYIENFHPEDRARVVESINATIYEGKPYSIDYRIIPHANVIRNVHAEGETTYDDNGIPTKFFGTVLDITERKQIEDALREARDNLEEKVKERTAELEEAYNSLLENKLRLGEAQKIAHLGNWDWNLLTDELYLSDEIYRIFGFDPLELIPTYNEFLSHVDPEDRSYVHNATLKALNGEPYDIEYRITLPNGEKRIAHSQGEFVFDEKCTPIRMRGVLQDITEHKKAQEALERMDKIRIKEIHHRIKNNLQVISSLLDLQAEKFEEEKVKEAFREGQNRVISMSLLHEELYKGEGTDTLDFSVYLQKLAENLFSTYNLYSKNVRLSMDLEDTVFLDMDTSVPLGIIVNELISNSLKHAFQGRQSGEIRIKLNRDECKSTAFILSISDNGVGIPENLDIEDLESLGLQLVTTLVDQLDGELEINRNNGTEFTVRFIVGVELRKLSPAAK
jgi:PAS domain S-box-containing protein